MTRRSGIRAFPAKTKAQAVGSAVERRRFDSSASRSPTRIRRRLPMTAYDDFSFVSVDDFADLRLDDLRGDLPALEVIFSAV
jgi:hypothetical protein